MSSADISTVNTKFPDPTVVTDFSMIFMNCNNTIQIEVWSFDPEQGNISKPPSADAK